MTMQRTFSIIKPDAFAKGAIGDILRMIEASGLKIIATKTLRMTKSQAEGFYAVHRERGFFGELVDFMSGGAIVPIALEKDNAVADYRTLIGATYPAEAADGTIRKNFASSKGENAVHGSDSVENARNEIAFFFAESEIVGNRA